MKQAMIFAAGLGTRLKPITDTMPKALVPVGGQPLLWHVVQKLKAAGFGRIVVNVHHFAQQIVDYLQANENFGLDIRISDESEQLLETGGGIKKALPLFDPESPILIHNVDILSNADLSTIYAYAEKATTLVGILPITGRSLIVCTTAETRNAIIPVDPRIIVEYWIISFASIFIFPLPPVWDCPLLFISRGSLFIFFRHSQQCCIQPGCHVISAKLMVRFVDMTHTLFCINRAVALVLIFVIISYNTLPQERLYTL